MDQEFKEKIRQSFESKRLFFDEGNTRSCEFRRDSLKALYATIKKYEDEITKALLLDFRKPPHETFISEIGLCLAECTHAIQHVRSWMSPKSVSTPIAILPATSKIYQDPKGVVVIFAPWNYPFNLVMLPLIGAIAAGNCVIVKPAHETSHTADVIEKIISESLDPNHVSVILGEGKVIGDFLLSNFTFNHIFFTGSPSVGKWVMEKASRTLTPVTLELGGKNPTIVDKNVNLNIAVTRIVWAKYFNCGQTCIGPDYVLVHADILEPFILALKKEIDRLYGENPIESMEFGRVISEERFDKLVSYLDQGELLHGGHHDRSQRYIEPTVMKVENLDQSIMQNEIFGPIMPIIIWKAVEDILPIVRRNRYPLSAYVFTNDPELERYVIENIEFGSGGVNDLMAQFANHHFPFGGVMASGVGRYHGRNTFYTFSNPKPILKTSKWVNMPMRFLPYLPWKTKIAKLFLR